MSDEIYGTVDLYDELTAIKRVLLAIARHQGIKIDDDGEVIHDANGEVERKEAK